MTTGLHDIFEPTAVVLHRDGRIDGCNSHYDKYLKDLAGIYVDDAAYEAEVASKGGDALAYWVEENRVGSGPGALILGTSIVLPGLIGQEYAMTRGHLHKEETRAEIYHCIAGHGVMLLDTVDGECRAMEMTPGVAVHVPGHWIHRSVNVCDEPLVTVFTYNADAGQNYDIIERAGGMSHLIVTDGLGGWLKVPNPRHRGYASS